MDYPLLERSYYNPVVNCDVFGKTARQAQTRFFFGLIRRAPNKIFFACYRPTPASAYSVTRAKAAG